MNRDITELFKQAITDSNKELMLLVLTTNELSYADMCQIISDNTAIDRVLGGYRVFGFNVKIHSIAPIHKKNYQPFNKLLNANAYKAVLVSNISQGRFGDAYVVRGMGSNTVITAKPSMFILSKVFQSLGISISYKQIKDNVLYEGDI